MSNDIQLKKYEKLMDEIEKYRRRKIVDNRPENLVYIDNSKNKRKIRGENNNVIIGRRGSGKTTLMISSYEESKDSIILKYDCQAIRLKKPNDIVTSILIKLLDELLLQLGNESSECLGYLNELLHILSDIDSLPESFEISKNLTFLEQNLYEEKQSSQSTFKYGASAMAGLDMKISKFKFNLKSNIKKFGEREKNKSAFNNSEIKSSSETNYSEVVEKEKLLDDLIDVLSSFFYEYMEKTEKKIALYLDDFYQINKDNQVRVINFLHNLYKQTPNGAFCFKLCILPNSIKLNKENENILSLKDDFSVIKLDMDLIDISGLTNFLIKILCSLNNKLDIQIEDIKLLFTNEDTLTKLVIASGGNPRDFILMFRDSYEKALENNNFKISAADIYSVIQVMRDEKDDEINYIEGVTQEMLELALENIEKQIIEKKATNIFLFADSDKENHENVIQNLVSARYLHLIKEGVSSENRKKEKFSAYLIDMSFYITGKQLKRNLKFREFWIKDTKSRYKNIDSAPIIEFD